jgi:hypothetical protein
LGKTLTSVCAGPLYVLDLGQGILRPGILSWVAWTSLRGVQVPFRGTQRSRVEPRGPGHVCWGGTFSRGSGSTNDITVSVFRPRGVPRPTSKLSPRAPAQMGRRETEHEGGKEGDMQKGKPAAFALSCAQIGCACSRGLQASAWEGARGLYAPSRSPTRPTFSYESPGPSFYRRKERAQVYNRRCSSVLTCLAERS